MFHQKLSAATPYICSSCALLQRRTHRPQRALKAFRQKRFVTQNYIRKTAEAEQQWNEYNKEIQSGQRQSMLSILEERGYIQAIAGGSRDNLDSLMNQKRVGVYLGVDPTAPSLHVGHLVPMMALFWMYVHGFHAITLLGGSTATIGDPTGRTNDRDRISSHVRKANMVTMHYQLKSIWMNIEKYASFYGYQWEWAWRRGIHNNNTWLNNLPMTEILRLLGSGLRVGKMLSKDTAKTKMESGDGLSFAEFTYPILQAFDWWHMYSTFQMNGIQLQIGGSDQYGNIMAGIDAVNHIRKTHYDPDIRQEQDVFLKKPMGFTVPLLTTSSGEKFGKSAGNAIWLDKDMTSPFDLYQFFLRSSDEDVGRYLKLFSFVPTQEIEALLIEHDKDRSKRVAQRRLAREALQIIHGEAETKEVEKQHGIFFQPSKSQLKRERRWAAMPEEKKENMMRDKTKSTDVSVLLNKAVGPDKIDSARTITLPKSLVIGQPVSRIFHSAGLVSSRSEGHRLSAAGGTYIGSLPGKQHTNMGDHVEFAPAANWAPGYADRFIIDGQAMFIRSGKWRVRIIKIISDEDFEKQGLHATGWKERKEELQKEKDLQNEPQVLEHIRHTENPKREAALEKHLTRQSVLERH